MRCHDDPEFLTPAERLQEIAAILAAGVLRLHRRAALLTEPLAGSAPENLLESGQDGLEVSEPPVLSVHRS